LILIQSSSIVRVNNITYQNTNHMDDDVLHTEESSAVIENLILRNMSSASHLLHFTSHSNV